MYKGKRRCRRGVKKAIKRLWGVGICVVLLAGGAGIEAAMTLSAVAAPRNAVVESMAAVERMAEESYAAEKGSKLKEDSRRGNEAAAGNKILSEGKADQGKKGISFPRADADCGVMYLTFDDGPSKEHTDKVLDVLKEKNVKATFFLIGEYVEKYPETARRIAAEGHTIGIHCYRHDYGEIYANKESYLADFQKAWDVVYKVTGVEAKLFRFPGGSVNAYNKGVREDIIAEMTARGFIYFDWNAGLEDAAGKYEPARLIKNARETTLGRKRIVMLAHDRVKNTALCLGDLIDQFSDYRMEPLTDKVEPIQF